MIWIQAGPGIIQLRTMYASGPHLAYSYTSNAVTVSLYVATIALVLY